MVSSSSNDADAPPKMAHQGAMSDAAINDRLDKLRKIANNPRDYMKFQQQAHDIDPSKDPDWSRRGERESDRSVIDCVRKLKNPNTDIAKKEKSLQKGEKSIAEAQAKLAEYIQAEQQKIDASQAKVDCDKLELVGVYTKGRQVVQTQKNYLHRVNSEIIEMAPSSAISAQLREIDYLRMLDPLDVYSAKEDALLHDLTSEHGSESELDPEIKVCLTYFITEYIKLIISQAKATALNPRKRQLSADEGKNSGRPVSYILS